jgi:hypothetical protein
MKVFLPGIMYCVLLHAYEFYGLCDVTCPGIFPSSFVLRAATAKGGRRQLRGQGSKNLRV